ncbi:hypothetical protein OG784_18760 [Streptomyces sp. NBC_01617]|uniref:hypothetical protein n=1 Tax=Streptomyces sp. NBC_01617 TaxID=2975899 RepID=UPI00386D55C7|nr:hypothetical protein OG784_18760 [Streptomyces sp. NBC_01617]
MREDTPYIDSFTRAVDATLIRRPGYNVSFKKSHVVACRWLKTQGEAFMPDATFRRLLMAVGVDLFEGEWGLALRDMDIELSAHRELLTQWGR